MVAAVVAAAEANDMAGILEALKIDDPATAQGLLQFGLSLLQSKGNLASAIGAAGQQGLQGSQQYRQNAFQKQQQQFQLDQQKRQREMQNLPGQFYRAPSEPGQDATGGMETALTNPNNAAGPGGFDAQGYGQALMGLDPAAGFQFQQMTRKAAPELKTFKPGDVAGTFENGVFKQSLAIPEKADKPAEQPSSVREYQFAVGQGYKGSFDEWNKATKKAGASNVSMSMGAEKKFSEAIGTAAAKTLGESQDAAQAAQGSLANATTVRDALKQGSVLLGPGAQTRQTGLRIGQVLGIGSKDSAGTLARTKQVEQGLASLELDAAALMKGQGVISESERLILRKVSGGQIQDLTPGELDTALTAIERNANRRIDTHRQRVKQIPAGAAGGLGQLLEAPAAGQGVRRFNPATGGFDAPTN